jgi:hypothetical protein
MGISQVNYRFRNRSYGYVYRDWHTACDSYDCKSVNSLGWERASCMKKEYVFEKEQVLSALIEYYIRRELPEGLPQGVL